MWWADLQGQEVVVGAGPDGRMGGPSDGPTPGSLPSRASVAGDALPVLPAGWSWWDTALVLAWLALDWMLSHLAGPDWLGAVRWRDGL
ncbi:MAG: hypothetical protein AMXMBFR77_28110 [Phycisphaerales bacterium]